MIHKRVKSPTRDSNHGSVVLKATQTMFVMITKTHPVTGASRVTWGVVSAWPGLPPSASPASQYPVGVCKEIFWGIFQSTTNCYSSYRCLSRVWKNILIWSSNFLRYSFLVLEMVHMEQTKAGQVGTTHSRITHETYLTGCVSTVAWYASVPSAKEHKHTYHQILRHQP